MHRRTSHLCLLVSVVWLAQHTGLAAPSIPDTVVWEEAIEYAAPDGQPLHLNMARPKTAAGLCPAVVCIHGGGFRAGKRENMDTQCVKLAERGYVAVTVSYRLAPAHRFPAAVHDVKAAVRWLRANARRYGVDPSRIGALGTSAGGSLAQLLGVTAHVPRFEGDGGSAGHSSAVACVVNIYGANDFTRSYGKSVDAHEVLPLWFGGDLATSRAVHVQGSPLFWVTPDAAPTRCLHGTKDTHVALEQSELLVERLRAAAVEADLVVLDGAGHGFKGADAERAQQAIEEFFARHLEPRRRAE